MGRLLFAAAAAQAYAGMARRRAVELSDSHAAEGAGVSGPSAKRLSLQDYAALHQRGVKISMISCYDVTSAQMVDEAGLHSILVGDSLGAFILGHPSPIGAT